METRPRDQKTINRTGKAYPASVPGEISGLSKRGEPLPVPELLGLQTRSARRKSPCSLPPLAVTTTRHSPWLIYLASSVVMNSRFAGIFFAASNAFSLWTICLSYREQVADVPSDHAVADLKAALSCPQEGHQLIVCKVRHCGLRRRLAARVYRRHVPRQTIRRLGRHGCGRVGTYDCAEKMKPCRV